MVPKTKNQKRVEELSSTLRCLKKKQEKWVNKTCFEHLGFRMKKGTTCLECGHEFHAIGERSKCPKCKTDLKIIDTRKRSNSSFAYACFIEVCQEWQVVRYFEVFQGYEKGKAVSYSSAEVVQIWLNGKGEVVCRARLKAGMFSSKFSWWSAMAIRRKTESYMYMSTDAEYPDMEIIPELTRNGFNGVIGSYPPQKLFLTLLGSPEMESLKKAGLDNFFDYFMRHNYQNIKDYWPSIKICLRNKYPLNKISPSTFMDHIDILKKFDKDIHSPKYVCPEDFEKEHMKYVNKQREIHRREERRRDQERLIRERKEMFALAEKFEKEKKKFSNLCITDGKIVVKPLVTVEEFEQESDIMGHCVFQKSYLQKDRLILSSEINGVKLETIEVNLNDFTISQCHGRKNKNTIYHKQIKELVQQNMELIQHPPKAKKVKLKTVKAA